MLTKKKNFLSFLPGERIQLCEYRSRERSVPPEDISKHCGFDYHKRRAGVDLTETDLSSEEGGRHEKRRETNREIYVDSHIFIHRGD